MSLTTMQIAKELASGNYGSFAQRLANAWFVADSTNSAIIEKAFAHLFKKVDSTWKPEYEEASAEA